VELGGGDLCYRHDQQNQVQEHQCTPPPFHLRTETDLVSETSCFIVSRIPDDARSPKRNPVILCVTHHRQNPSESTSTELVKLLIWTVTSAMLALGLATPISNCSLIKTLGNRRCYLLKYQLVVNVVVQQVCRYFNNLYQSHTLSTLVIIIKHIYFIIKEAFPWRRVLHKLHIQSSVPSSGI
jgi:hypothetical protein